MQIYAPRAEIIGGLLEKADSADEVNLDTETGSEYNNNRGDDNGVYHDGRTAQNERELEEAGYEDAGGNSENERAWGESEEAFAARAQRNANKAGRGKRVLLKHGSGSLAYTEKSEDNTEASRAAEWLKRSGVKAVYCDGDIETNQNGVTTIHREAMTAPDGTAYESLRLAVFHDALQDMRALELCEKLCGRDFVINLIEESCDCEITFSEYPRKEKYILNLRERINNAIKESL